MDAQTSTILDFVRSIGLTVVMRPIDVSTVLPGMTIDEDALVVDTSARFAPGDLLHEAAHLAIVPPDRRGSIGIAYDVGAEEMMAIGWSYAAALHLRLDPAVVFHADGYRGGSGSLLDNFADERYVGVPMLQWIGLTADPARAVELGVASYPHMLRWVAE